MQLPQLFTLTLISTAAALDVYFFCHYKTLGKCCMRFNPDTGTGDLCGPATRKHMSIEPGPPPEWACPNNVDRVPACCYPPTPKYMQALEAEISVRERFPLFEVLENRFKGVESGVLAAMIFGASLPTALLAATALATTAIPGKAFYCPIGLIGACCQQYRIHTDEGKSCKHALQLHSLETPETT
ncbi:hypothetical protein F5882DRAFT_464662 [Hyaloscypha sp. PMI_1271]|nr:hypothetical protein F5882DRAFT_464662 [Hyaloscypha sp. PMI_1271]